MFWIQGWNTEKYLHSFILFRVNCTEGWLMRLVKWVASKMLSKIPSTSVHALVHTCLLELNTVTCFQSTEFGKLLACRFHH